jgi:hypothetical protein
MEVMRYYRGSLPYPAPGYAQPRATRVSCTRAHRPGYSWHSRALFTTKCSRGDIILRPHGASLMSAGYKPALQATRATVSVAFTHARGHGIA